MKRIAYILFSVLLTMGCKENLSELNQTSKVDDWLFEGEWHWANFTEVRAFRINGNDDDSSNGIVSLARREVGGIIYDEKHLNDTRLPKEGILLTPLQVKKLGACVYANLQTGKEELNVEVVKWPYFYPRYAFLFYDDEGNITGGINICFEHSSYDGWPTGFLNTWDLPRLRLLVEDLDLPTTN